MQRDLKQQITPRESGARHEEDPPADADPERSSGNHAHGIPGGSAYSTNRRIHGWPVCVRHPGCLHRAVGRDRTWRVPPRSSTGSPVPGPDLSLSRARDPTPDGTTAEVDSQANKKEFIIFFLLLNNAKSNQKNMQK